MAQVLETIPPSNHPDLLVGYNKADDAGVFRLSENLAIVNTLDFFPPIVDNPYDFGRITAANALSDIYAMGGRPLTALNIVAFPVGQLPPEILSEILRGGAEKIEEAGAVIVGGHSIKDKELKYGLAVTGIIDPYKIVTNSNCRVGDRLYLTKPLGTGLITTGIKNSAVEPEMERVVTSQMAQLNRKAAELMVELEVKAATDITGYGLLGHAFELAEGSSLTIRISSANIPIMPQAMELAETGLIPGGTGSNREFLEGKIDWQTDASDSLQAVLFDPQTSGGLLISVPSKVTERFESELADRKIFGPMIGQVETRGEYPLIVE